jgi:hypothetical protein
LRHGLGCGRLGRCWASRPNLSVVATVLAALARDRLHGRLHDCQQVRAPRRLCIADTRAEVELLDNDSTHQDGRQPPALEHLPRGCSSSSARPYARPSLTPSVTTPSSRSLPQGRRPCPALPQRGHCPHAPAKTDDKEVDKPEHDLGKTEPKPKAPNDDGVEDDAPREQKPKHSIEALGSANPFPREFDPWVCARD